MLGNVTRTALISYFNAEASLARQGKIADQSLTAFGFNQSDIEKVRGNEQNSGSNVRQNTQGQDQNKGLQPQQPINGMRQQQQETQPQNPPKQP